MGWYHFSLLKNGGYSPLLFLKYNFVLSSKFLPIILSEKKRVFNWVGEGLRSPIGLTKNSKMRVVMDRCLKSDFFVTLHFWGVKWAEKVH